MAGFPSVSIIIVNLNGKTHLYECLGSIEELDYPKDKTEVILVDNGSTDGSVEFVKEKFPWVKLIVNDKNEGFAKPSDDGAKAASGKYVAFLNNDMKVKSDWLSKLIDSLRVNGAQCAGSVILDWDGKLLDFAGGAFNFMGMAYQFDFHSPVSGLSGLDSDREILFACGGAMIADREKFLAAGGFDEDFFAYFEDVDFGWRFRLLGNKTVLSVKSRVYHRHHGTAKFFDKYKMDLLYNRNSLYMTYKNFSGEMIQKEFWPYLLMNYRFLYDRSGLDAEDYDITSNKKDTEFPELDPDMTAIHKRAAAKICTMQDFINNLPKMSEKRKFIQSSRKVPDSEIFKFIRDPFMPLGEDLLSYQNIKYEFAKIFGMDKAFGVELKRTVLVICTAGDDEPWGQYMRYWEAAKALLGTGEFNVTAACPENVEILFPEIPSVTFTPERCEGLVGAAVSADVVLLGKGILETVPRLRNILNGKFVAADIGGINVCKAGEIGAYDNTFLNSGYRAGSVAAAETLLKYCDFFLCADESQRDYCLKKLSEYGRAEYGGPMTAVVRYGVPDRPPLHDKYVLRGVLPGINQNDKILICAEGFSYNSYAPDLIRAMDIVYKKRKDIKLFFMRDTRTEFSPLCEKKLGEAAELAKILGLYEKNVFFGFKGIEYKDRQNYLLEADAGIICNFDVAANVSTQTVMLEYVWTGLPVIYPEGEFTAGIKRRELGVTIKNWNPKTLAEAFLLMFSAENADNYKKFAANAQQEADNRRWSEAVKPFADFCRRPFHYAARDLSGSGFYVSQNKKNASARAPAGRDMESIVKMIGKIEQHQEVIESGIIDIKRNEKISLKLIRELQTFSYIMNKRFNKLKHILNPFVRLKTALARISGKK